MSFVEFVIELHHTLDRAGMAHAFGGALALAYVAEPRGTVDVDVNVFSADVEPAIGVLNRIGLLPEEAPDRWLPIAGIRLRSDRGLYPVDLFPSLDDRYAEMETRIVQHPFGPGSVRSIATTGGELDVDYIERQLIGLRGPAMYPRLSRFRRLLREGRA